MDRLREVSRAAFGQMHRLELMLAILAVEDGIVTLTEVHRSMSGVAMSSLQKPFEALIECGLLTRLPNGDSRSRFYVRNDSAAWSWAVELSEAAGVPALLACRDAPISQMRS